MAPATTSPKVVTLSDHRPGLTVALIGGVHGDEFYGPAAILAVEKRLRDRDIVGKVILVAVANPFAAIERSRSAVQLAGNLNRQFGDAPRAADPKLYALARTLWVEHLSQADVVVDVHSGGHQRILPHARFSGDSEKVVPLVGAIGIQYAMKYRSLPPGLLISRARQNGITSFGLEVGGGLELHPPVLRSLSAGLWSLLVHLGVVAGTAKKVVMPRLVSPGPKQRANTSGFWIPMVDVGERVGKGDRVGEFTSFFSHQSRWICARSHGIVFTVLTGGPAARGETMVEIVVDGS